MPGLVVDIVDLPRATGSVKNLRIRTPAPADLGTEVIGVPEDSDLAARKAITLQDVEAHSLIMLKEGSFLRQMMLQKMKTASVTPNIVLESNQVVTIMGLVASGVGIAFLLDMIVRDTPGIRAIPLATPVYVDVGLAWKRDRYISRAAQSFIEFSKDILSHQPDHTIL